MSSREIPITVQGFGSPVPASGAGEKAGPGTSFSDCSSRGADHLAPSEFDASSDGMKKQAWDRHEKLIVDLLTQITEKRSINEQTRQLARSVQSSAKRIRSMHEGEAKKTPPANITAHKPQVRDVGIQGGSNEVEPPEIGTGKRKKRDSPGTYSEALKRKKQEKTPSPAKRGPKRKKKGPQGTAGSKGRLAKDKRKQDGQAQEESDGASGWEQWKRRKKKDDLPQMQPRRDLPQRRVREALRTRPNALIIRPKNKEKYPEILSRIKKEVPIETASVCVDKIRRTATGDLLIILAKGNEDKGQDLEKAITKILGEKAIVRSKGPQEELEIKDLDEGTTKSDVLEALRGADGDNSEITLEAIKSLRRAYRGTQIASVTLPAFSAKKILGERGKIRIGWVNCRVVPEVRPLKCFKCWHYGHLASSCRSEVDRSRLCAKCGEAGHKVADCGKPARCVLCAERTTSTNVAHIAGSSKCPVYQEALQKTRTKK